MGVVTKPFQMTRRQRRNAFKSATGMRWEVLMHYQVGDSPMSTFTVLSGNPLARLAQLALKRDEDYEDSQSRGSEED